MSTSSSSPTYPTIQREHSVHPAHLQDHSVDKLRHQESLWREDLQSDGNPRTTTPTVSNWCEQIGLTPDKKGQERILEKGESVNKEILKSVNSQEVNSLVFCPRQASGNRLRENKLRITLRDYSINKGLRTRIFLVPGIGWYEIQDQT